MMHDTAKLRMSVYEDHKLDCAGCCDPLDWHTFKHVWGVTKGDWAEAFLLAARIASGETTFVEATKEKFKQKGGVLTKERLT